MSTKAIRKVLRDLQCDYTPCLPGLCRKHDAMAEVEAIEQAAKVALRDKADEFVATKDLNTAYALMASIAKDAP